MKKNRYGDDVGSDTEKNARTNALYDLADILATSRFVDSEPENSYKNPSEPPKNLAHKDVKYWYKFENDIIFDGQPYLVVFNIRDKGKDGQYQYLIEFHEKKASEQAIQPKTAYRQYVQKPFGNSIPQTDANGNISGENVTQLQQSKRQMAFTDESDELFERPVNNTPILSAEELAKRNEEFIRQDNARREAAIANNRRLREQGVLAMANASEDAAEDLSGRDDVLDEFWAETYQDGPEDIEASREEYEQFWRDFQARSDELAAESGNKTGMEDLAAFLASEREITEAEMIAQEESARGKIAFSEGAAESDANAFTRDMLNGIAKDGFDKAQKKAASDMGFAVGKITWADSKAFDEAVGKGDHAGFDMDFPLTVDRGIWYNFFGICRENTQRRHRNVQTNPGLLSACSACGGFGGAGLCCGKAFSPGGD